jgi:3-deoxy-D-manno-octulosonic-acid transferase
MGMSLALAGYLAFSARAEPFANRTLARRLSEGKEDGARIEERRGIASQPKPEGPLIWLHAASVGESISLLELLRRMSEERPELRFLVTTGTITSAQVMAARLPDTAIHQYVPLDALVFIRRFLDHWKPDLAVWTESEFWPAMMSETAKREIPMVLINARISKGSYDKWRFLRGMAKSLLRRFDYAQAQDEVSAGLLRRLGMPSWRMTVTGTLKEGAAALPCIESDRADFAARLSGRPVWVAASTHEGEERQVLTAHRLVMRSNPRLLLILVPRHPHRAAAVAELLAEDDWIFSRRSEDALPDSEDQVYLADTLGELGLWYRVSPISFVGGSLEPFGGHNPFEPAALGSAILHGPFVSNFTDIFLRLTEAGASRLITSATDLAAAVDDLQNPERAATMAHAAWEVCSAGAEVTDRTMEMLLEHLDTAERKARTG